MNNPIANDTFIGKMKNKVGKKQKHESVDKAGSVRVETLTMNDYVNICASACACCWDRPVPESFEDKAEYIAKRVRTGHSSVIEHSNYVIFIETPKEYFKELITIISNCKYLNVWNEFDGDKALTIIGGSFRGYSEMYKEIYDFKNPILTAITYNLCNHVHSAMFEDLIKIGIFDRSDFKNLNPDVEGYREYNKVIDLYNLVAVGLVNDEHKANSDCSREDYCIQFKKFYENLKEASPEAWEKIKLKDAVKFLTITVLFENMSRTCTHQLVRHRNAITQESQRYVDMSGAKFSSPYLFKPDKYDAEHKYTIRFPNLGRTELTLQEIGEAECSIYEQLSNKAITGAANALIKEDARAYLPGNVQCGKIYMTFTYKNLFKFLELRTHKSAQAEIRLYATELEYKLRKANAIFEDYKIFIESSFEYLSKVDSITEDDYRTEEDAVEVVDITEDDYIKAIGLDKEENE